MYGWEALAFEARVESGISISSKLPSEWCVDGPDAPNEFPQVAGDDEEDVADVGHDVPVEWDGLKNLLSLPLTFLAAAVGSLSRKISIGKVTAKLTSIG